MSGLPGGDLVAQGLSDLAAGRETIAALLVSIGAPRLSALGIAVPGSVRSPELRLYRLLAREGERDAHSRFNALVRRLVSYERALELLRGRERRMAGRA
jgi:hypothetical protein